MTKATFLNAFRKISGIVAMLLLTSWLATAQNKDGGITLNMENASIEQVIKAIEQQSRFLFINKGVDIQKKVSVNVSNVPVQNALGQIFKGTDVAWNLDGTYIILSKKSAKAEGDVPVTITGTVTDNHGEPIPGAAVMIAGTTTGAITDFDGNYSITVPPPTKGKRLEFNVLGYET
ncbi:MAG: carboxypeptidase-like regulatory domain-containing protein, partial [Bacteroidales bacterium]|nr:carboxypeptidase-like regulatory domain-containing protein [Bacteroidales bacterium]